MKTDTFLLPAFFDYGATFLWAVSGALLAARRGNDVIGMLILALVSSTGGGLLRDGIFLQQGPPLLVQSPKYLTLVLIATAFVVLFGRFVPRARFDRLVNLVDGLGLGAYAVVGMNRATALNLSLLGVVLVGMVNAVGGAVLRAVLIAKEPQLFRPGTLLAVAALIGCAVFLSLTRLFGVGQTTSAWITIATVFIIRAVSVQYHIETKPLSGFTGDWKAPAD
ncbi:MAG TPA: TRIC cation channel family protein [Gemmatimonadaceae bacterium]|nr:TRIC cation channel family protein [Gemmatimonadaceae bacterium]